MKVVNIMFLYNYAGRYNEFNIAISKIVLRVNFERRYQNICSRTTKLVANTINMYMYVTFNLLMVLEKKTFFRKLTIYVAPATNQIKHSDKSLMKCGELFNKHFCKNKILLSPMRQ